MEENSQGRGIPRDVEGQSNVAGQLEVTRLRWRLRWRRNVRVLAHSIPFVTSDRACGGTSAFRVGEEATSGTSAVPIPSFVGYLTEACTKRAEVPQPQINDNNCYINTFRNKNFLVDTWKLLPDSSETSSKVKGRYISCLSTIPWVCVQGTLLLFHGSPVWPELLPNFLGKWKNIGD